MSSKPIFQESFGQFDRYVETRMEAARTPGVAIAFTDREKTLRLATYGFADPDAGSPVLPDTLFEIGSISKTFTAVAAMQAVEDGLLDLHAPVTEYLPWFRVRSRYDASITCHHLLSHTAGLPYSIDFSPDCRAVVYSLRQVEPGFAPGSHYFYSEPGYQALSLVLEAVRGKCLAEILGEGVLQPLGMGDSTSVISHDLWPRLAKGYRFLYDDRPPHPSQPLVPADWLEFASGDGCIASTASDMAKFARMLLNRGQGAEERLLSEESFRRMTTPVIKEAEYGYGILAFDDAGFSCIGHAGDMPGYEASLWLDTDAGLGVAVLLTQPGLAGLSWTALQVLRAVRLDQALPDLALPNPVRVPNAPDYAGVFRARTSGVDTRRTGDEEDGQGSRKCDMTLVAERERLLLLQGGDRIALEPRGQGRFFVNHPAWNRFLLRFKRAGDGGPVTEAYYGPEWYTGDAYDGPQRFEVPEAWLAYPGHYRAFNPWQSNLRVVQRKGGLYLCLPSGDEDLLVAREGGSFRVGGEAHSPERLHFDQIVEGQALRATLSGVAYYRFFTE